MIDLKNIYKTYKIGNEEIHALDGVSLKIDAGELLSIMGPSGSGKTTLMHILGLLDQPTSGEYFLDGEATSHFTSDKLASLRNHSIGFVFQSFFLLPRLDAISNVELPLLYRGTPKAERRERAMESLKKVEMGDYYHHRPSQLSGGQQQRVAIARALVGEPAIIMADEPTGQLDSKVGAEVMSLLKHLNHDSDTTIIVVTHDLHVAQQCNRIIKIRDGKVEE